MEKKNSGLTRQDAFVRSTEVGDFDFGLVLTQAFLKGIRDIGYKSTATALFESIDNSIEAEADNIHILFDFDKGKSGKSEPDRIAIVDDGHGMSKEMSRISVLWGGSDRLDNREGMGKYGYGLPSSCVSIGQKFTVISKRADMKDWYSVTIDIEEIAHRNPEYIDKKTGKIIAPIAKVTRAPGFVERYLQSRRMKMTNGTIVLIEKIDRLSKRSFKPLKSFLSLETGVTYRNYLRQVNIYIDGDLVQPVDPLFATEGYRYYDENDLRAEPLPSLEIKVANALGKRKEGTIKVRYSYLPYGFFKSEDDDVAQVDEPEDGDDEESKKKRSKRLTVRKRNNGIIFLRKGRQIDVVDSKCPWTKFQNNDRYVGVDIDFSPELDEEFSITTSKQQIVVSERLWNILRDNGVYEAIQSMRKKYEKQAKDAKIKLQSAKNATPAQSDEFTEGLMKDSLRDFEVGTESQPQHVKKEGEENLRKRARKIAKETGLSEAIVKQELEAQMESKPYKLEYFDQTEGPFYRAEQLGGQVVIYINKAHRFYTDVFANSQTTPFFKNALAMLIFALGHSELRVADDKRKWYVIERNVWSGKLESTLDTLSKHFDTSTDDEVFEEEIRMNDR